MTYHWNVDFHSFGGRNFDRNFDRNFVRSSVRSCCRYTRYSLGILVNWGLSSTWTSRETRVACMTDYRPFVAFVRLTNSYFDCFA